MTKRGPSNKANKIFSARSEQSPFFGVFAFFGNDFSPLHFSLLTPLLITDHRSLFIIPYALALPTGLCQDLNMKQFFLGYLLPALIIPSLSMSQTAQLTEQLGKTVLYGDIALSPDGSHVAWIQSTAATTSKRAHILAT